MTKPQWDFFISHASEDKNDFVRPLAETLNALGFKVWYDEFSLKLGDSLNQSINHGLANSHFGIVILSPNFLRKNWTQRELDGLVSEETIFGRRKILPIWHKINAKKVAKYSPTLAGIKAVSTSQKSLEEIIREIIRAVEGKLDMPEHLPSPAHDVLLPNDVLLAFKSMEEFKDQEIDNENLTDIYQGLWIWNINTLEKLRELVSSKKIIVTLKQVYQEELLRPNDNVFEPGEFVTGGAYFLRQQITPASIEEFRNVLRGLNEYQKKHPGTKIAPTTVIHANKITSGTQFVSLFAHAHVLISEHDQPSNEEEAESIAELIQFSEYLDVLDNSQLVGITLDIDRAIQQLESIGYYVYGAVKEGHYLNVEMNVVFIMIRRQNLPVLLGLFRATKTLTID